MSDQVACFVTAKERSNLPLCLMSLEFQGEPHKVIIVDLTQTGEWMFNKKFTTNHNISGCTWAPHADMYEATMLAISEHNSLLQDVGWFCFPNDDCYLVPGYLSQMLRTAHENNLEFVYCDIVYDPRLEGYYCAMDTQVSPRKIDKISMMVSKEAFFRVGGFKDFVQTGDYLFAKSLVDAGIRHGKAKGVLAVHN